MDGRWDACGRAWDADGPAGRDLCGRADMARRARGDVGGHARGLAGPHRELPRARSALVEQDPAGGLASIGAGEGGPGVAGGVGRACTGGAG